MRRLIISLSSLLEKNNLTEKIKNYTVKTINGFSYVDNIETKDGSCYRFNQAGDLISTTKKVVVTRQTLSYSCA